MKFKQIISETEVPDGFNLFIDGPISVPMGSMETDIDFSELIKGHERSIMFTLERSNVLYTNGTFLECPTKYKRFTCSGIWFLIVKNFDSTYYSDIIFEFKFPFFSLYLNDVRVMTEVISFEELPMITESTEPTSTETKTEVPERDDFFSRMGWGVG